MPLQTGETRMVEEHLHSRLPAARVDVYRQNSASIRVRIIDGNFTGQSRIDREEKVLPYSASSRRIPGRTSRCSCSLPRRNRSVRR